MTDNKVINEIGKLSKNEILIQYKKQFDNNLSLIAKLNNASKQIAELKAENEILKKYETIYYLNQLQASNEDINKFKQNEFHQCINISDLLKDNTKQVCEKIRKWGNKHFNWVGDGTEYDGQDYNEMIGFNNAITKLLEFLDQIEKGE